MSGSKTLTHPQVPQQICMFPFLVMSAGAEHLEVDSPVELAHSEIYARLARQQLQFPLVPSAILEALR